MTIGLNPQFEFHISRRARDLYQFDETIFALSGNVLFANFHAARQFAQKMNEKRDLLAFPEQAVRAGQVNALGLVDEILHMVVGQYRRQANPQAMAAALKFVEDRLGVEAVSRALRRFAEEYPPLSVYRRQMSLEDYLGGETDGLPNREILLEEMLMLWVANANPACSPYLELFDDSALATDTAYSQIITGLRLFFDGQPHFGPDPQNLVDLLRSPAVAVPHSLPGQLEYIRLRWGGLLDSYLYRLLTSLDLIKEEQKIYFMGGGPAPAEVYEFAGQELEPEAFSPDREWMPSLVLLAKNAYVWLDQLTKQHGRPITRLDEIPEEELDGLRQAGFTGLWLIGLWERSPASKTIKQLRGNPDAVASAYSLFSYDIASDLGGDEAYRTLRDRAWKRGIRLASDMVPNHMGIDSRWVIENPSWFVSLDYPPFPSYSFTGPNLSWDPRVTLQIEDHYFDNSDAAVVFKRTDNWSGETKYIYHGNDGTSMPWNDTAQLNYLLPVVREAVIQTILHVARKFPIIRFDAAMTLAKRHYHRLWFPEPGSGGDIASRAGLGLTKEQFDAAMPVEFWREVVDRVAQEAPDTLLLAEAFWLMEGYFVRTLGMHRVYNSAFMNMLRDEKNQEYRLVIKNTLEFDPEILKRYVNFMNNPDEKTAVDQFGKGDKYFGICTLLATLPGLPMFGHGQVQGYTEKYGMEYRRAYWDEKPDPYLVGRHEREIFPLLRKRYLFADASNFRLYDLEGADGSVNEDVYAFTNRAGDERALVVFHNKYARAAGWLRTSSAYPEKSGGEGGRSLARTPLADSLGLRNEAGWYAIFRDQVSGLEYIRSCQELHAHGLYIELEAYQYHVFTDLRQAAEDAAHPYGQLAAYLGGRPVPSVEDALKEIFLGAVHVPFRELANAGFFQYLIDSRLAGRKAEGRKAGAAREKAAERPPSGNFQEAVEQVEWKARELIEGARSLVGGAVDAQQIAWKLRQEAAALLALPSLEDSGRLGTVLKAVQTAGLRRGHAAAWGPLLGWLAVHRLGEAAGGGEAAGLSRSWMDEWLLGKILAAAFQGLGQDAGAADRAVSLVRLLVAHQGWYDGGLAASQRPIHALQGWFTDQEVQGYLGVNRYQGVLWFNQEAFDEWLGWMDTLAIISLLAEGGYEPQRLAERGEAAAARHAVIQALRKAAKKSRYQVEYLFAAARSAPKQAKTA